MKDLNYLTIVEDDIKKVITTGRAGGLLRAPGRGLGLL
jgi:hypothetical protein